MKSGANVALGFTEKHVVPPILAYADAEMVCNTGSALTPAIMSTKGMGADPARVAVLMYAASGVCAEKPSIRTGVTHYLRASKAGQVTEAQDATYCTEALGCNCCCSDNTQAIKSSLLIVGNLNTKYHLGDSYPTMRSDIDQTVYLLGMISGLQAGLTNDINSGGSVNVRRYCCYCRARYGLP